MIASAWKGLSGDAWGRLGLTVALTVFGLLSWAGAQDVGDWMHATSSYTHLHCSECLEEMPYSSRWHDKPCPDCVQPASRMIATQGSIREGGGEMGIGLRLGIYGLAGAIVLQGLYFFGLWRSRTVSQREEDERSRPLVCLCPFCKRKLGYPAWKQGQSAVCSRCKTTFLLPTEAAASEA